MADELLLCSETTRCAYGLTARAVDAGGPIDFEADLNQKRLSQPEPDRNSLAAAWRDQPASAYPGRM